MDAYPLMFEIEDISGSRIHPFTQHILSAYSVPGTVLGANANT
jgi:hypothetical protein